MKTLTTESQIDALLSSVFQSEVPSEHAFECVDRLLSAFKQVGQTPHREAYSFGTMFTGDENYES